ncbi:sugar MFS transporter [Pseudoxanthomonas sacheonensis]|uniref:sugar MFS transporter n=1 Tax=Pseudoxanthomonas sacheonensis TaxID=443615 RepID=UPI0013D0BA57|nr:sugar MFS transporter [Pseudoxanthomonas sacheonensis]KAF1708125.1 hypothetical protein CSC73_09265 [Pseudoxanthomonas sacheonensis]
MHVSHTLLPREAGTPALAIDTRMALPAVATIFFTKRFMACLNGILIPHLKAAFESNCERAMRPASVALAKEA